MTRQRNRGKQSVMDFNRGHEFHEAIFNEHFLSVMCYILARKKQFTQSKLIYQLTYLGVYERSAQVSPYSERQ